MAYWAGSQQQEAIDELLAMIKLDRNWNEAAARQQLLKFFEALGFTDPLAAIAQLRGKWEIPDLTEAQEVEYCVG